MKPTFTIGQIEQAHQKVKSGADFPNYIQALKNLGIARFETWTADSHTVYQGTDSYCKSSPPQYTALSIAAVCNKTQFLMYLKLHQQGQTDYYTFCQHCAETGINSWVVSLNEMTCTYFDVKGQAILTEQIPNK